MTTSPIEVWFDENSLWVRLSDSRTLGVPIEWFPRLAQASSADRNNFELSPYGIHWENLDEDISIEGLLEGRGDVTNSPRNVA